MRPLPYVGYDLLIRTADCRVLVHWENADVEHAESSIGLRRTDRGSSDQLGNDKNADGQSQVGA
jgi:hypothetical protein